MNIIDKLREDAEVQRRKAQEALAILEGLAVDLETDDLLMLPLIISGWSDQHPTYLLVQTHSVGRRQMSAIREAFGIKAMDKDFQKEEK